MELLTRALGARRAVEIGTFTGFSALCIARGLAADGSLLCLDRSEEWTTVARRYWERAGLADRIELRLGDALPLLRAVPAVETFDLAFVDADKTGYAAYVEELHPRMTTNGVVLLDNTLRVGQGARPAGRGRPRPRRAERRARVRPALGDGAAAARRRPDHAPQAMSAPTRRAARVSSSG